MAQVNIARFLNLVVAASGAYVVANLARAFVMDRLEDGIIWRKPEEKLRSRRLRLWRLARAKKGSTTTAGTDESSQCPDEGTITIFRRQRTRSEETRSDAAKRYARILGSDLRLIHGTHYDRAVETEIFNASVEAEPLQERELAWVQGADQPWAMQTAFLLGGDDQLLIMSPAAALELGYMDPDTNMVKPEHASALPRWGLAARPATNRISAVKVSLGGKEWTFEALVKELNTRAVADVRQYVILPSVAVMRMEGVHEAVMRELIPNGPWPPLACRDTGRDPGSATVLMHA